LCAFSVHHTWRVRWKVLGAGVDEGLGTLRWQGSGTWRARLRSRFRAGAEMFVALVRFEGLQPGLFRLVFSPQVFDQHIRSCGQNDAGYPKKETVSTNSHHPDARVRDPGVEVARNGGFRRRIHTDVSIACFVHVCVEFVRVDVAWAMHTKSGVARRPSWPHWLIITLRWPTSHRGFNVSIYYGL
jgi:hypothetical protein